MLTQINHQVADLSAPLPGSRDDIIIVCAFRRGLRSGMGGLRRAVHPRRISRQLVLLQVSHAGRRLGSGLRRLVLCASCIEF